VKSGFGRHLVKITHREESRIPEWTDVRDHIAEDMQYEGRKAAEDQFYAEVLPRYQVVCSEEVSALLKVMTVEGRRSMKRTAASVLLSWRLRPAPRPILRTPATADAQRDVAVRFSVEFTLPIIQGRVLKSPPCTP